MITLTYGCFCQLLTNMANADRHTNSLDSHSSHKSSRKLSAIPMPAYSVGEGCKWCAYIIPDTNLQSGKHTRNKLDPLRMWGESAWCCRQGRVQLFHCPDLAQVCTGGVNPQQLIPNRKPTSAHHTDTPSAAFSFTCDANHRFPTAPSISHVTEPGEAARRRAR